MGLADEGN